MIGTTLVSSKTSLSHLITLLEHSHGKPTHWNQDTGWYRRFAMSKLNIFDSQILLMGVLRSELSSPDTPALLSLASFVLKSCEAHASPGHPWRALCRRLQTQEWRWPLGLRSTFPSPGGQICLEQISLSGVVRSFAFFCLNSIKFPFLFHGFCWCWWNSVVN